MDFNGDGRDRRFPVSSQGTVILSGCQNIHLQDGTIILGMTARKKLAVSTGNTEPIFEY